MLLRISFLFAFRLTSLDIWHYLIKNRLFVFCNNIIITTVQLIFVLKQCCLHFIFSHGTTFNWRRNQFPGHLQHTILAWPVLTTIRGENFFDKTNIGLNTEQIFILKFVWQVHFFDSSLHTYSGRFMTINTFRSQFNFKLCQMLLCFCVRLSLNIIDIVKYWLVLRIVFLRAEKALCQMN